MIKPDLPPLPDDLVEALRQLCDDADREAFRIGRFLADAWDEFGGVYTALHGGNERAAHAWFIGYLAARTGREASTLRDRERVARYVTPDMAAEHPFTFHQWRAIMSAEPERRGDYIAWMHAEAERNGGGFPSVAAIRDEIAADRAGAPAWVRRYARVQRAAAALASDAQVPPRLRAVLRALAMLGDD